MLGSQENEEEGTDSPYTPDSHTCMKWSEVAQSCLTLCDLMDCSLLDSSVHGIFQARILEWVAFWQRKLAHKPHTCIAFPIHNISHQRVLLLQLMDQH